MDQGIANRFLTLVTTFEGRTIRRQVTAYADLFRIVPGLSYDQPIATVTNASTGEETIVCIKPFAQATLDDMAAL